MDEQLIAIVDALDGIKLLPRRTAERNVLYGYVHKDEISEVIAAMTRALHDHGYEVHCCDWPDNVVLLALNTTQPFAIRITSSTTERYNLYVLSRPQTPQALWQSAQVMLRQQVRERRDRTT